MIISPAERLQHFEEYYFSKKLEEIRLLNRQGHDILNLGIGSPDLMPSETTVKALVESAWKPGNHGYQSYRGIPQLRSSFASWYTKTYGVELDPETEILPLMGSKEGITHISLAFLNPGDKVLVPELGYPAYRSATLLAGGIPVNYPLDEKTWYPDFAAFSRIDLTSVKIIWINYPHMPTGAPPSREMFGQLVSWASEKNILIAHDNPYGLVLNETPPLSILYEEGAMDVAIELNSLSKSHNMAGWRVGWVSGHKDYINTILKVKSNFDSGMFRGIQDAAVEAMNNPPQWHDDRNSIYRDRRAAVWEMLDKLGCEYSRNQVGMFLWALIPAAIDDVEDWVDHILHNHNVFFTPGFIFGSKGRRFIRISLCSDRKIFIEAKERLKNLNYPKK
ncbi:MAG TPA: aminotransferase class I/II-fold pyridoxal phosphate-dependent enzyme [Cyclobacteriaceae bacterium]|nr:aminotransferase class I/II-fold pyridoxal phosphate-dependent enzyme [Cyclobacteriaceae bacterium]